MQLPHYPQQQHKVGSAVTGAWGMVASPARRAGGRGCGGGASAAVGGSHRTPAPAGSWVWRGVGQDLERVTASLLGRAASGSGACCCCKADGRAQCASPLGSWPPCLDPTLFYGLKPRQLRPAAAPRLPPTPPTPITHNLISTSALPVQAAPLHSPAPRLPAARARRAAWPAGRPARPPLDGWFSDRCFKQLQRAGLNEIWPALPQKPAEFETCWFSSC